jgi:alpha-galactosidase
MPITAQDQTWILETDHTAYTFGLNAFGLLTHAYWGPRLLAPEDYPPPPTGMSWASFNNPPHLTPEEYPAYHEMKFIEPCLKVTFANGARDAALRFQSAHIKPGDGETSLHISLRDRTQPFEVLLTYTLYEGHDLIGRSATLVNHGTEPVLVERMWSAQWHLPVGDSYRFSHLTGRWADEFHLRREPLQPGVKVIESRRLHTSHHHNPWFAIDRGSADEDQGEVWYGAFAWSGNWKIAAEVTDFASTRVNVGLNDWDFAYRLMPGESFTTPAAYAGYTSHGFGAASRALHDFIRDAVLPHRHAPHRVLFNSWEATFFDVDIESQTRYAEIAASLGVELFVMDDGWFHGRNHDRAGLGDWWPDARKFPQGLAPLIERVNALGMDFGLWIEPEMVNPDSDLYRAHPDWVLHFPDRLRTEGRSQLILNLGRPDVQAYLLERLDALLRDNNIAFIKWDMNRTVSEPGWPDYDREPREIWVRYVEGLYRLWGTLRERHPHVIWQSCSGGGGRADLGILRYADQIWVSDNTGPVARLGIQEGFSQVFPASVMEAWVTDMEPQSWLNPQPAGEYLPLSFRFHVSMCGTLGIGANITRWGEAELEEARRWVAVYKELRPIIQEGDLYRLRSAQTGNGFSAVQYVSKDKAESVLFAFRTLIPDPANLPPLRLRGLDPRARYTVEGLEGVRSGLAWMNTDLLLPLHNFESTLRRVRRV